MNRLIKFRGKRLDTGEWIFGCLINILSDATCIVRYDGSLCKVDPDTVGQFTGLLDKNETPIYEGDIIRLEPGSIAVVLWNEEYSAFCIRLALSSKLGSRPLGNWINYFGRKIEVIGSIQDTPELLNDKTENI